MVRGSRWNWLAIDRSPKLARNLVSESISGRYGAINSFHEKAGQSQVGFSFPVRVFFGFWFEPSRLCRHPSIRTLCVSDVRSVPVGCSRFSRCCYLISALRFLCPGKFGPGLSRSHLNSAVEPGCSVTISSLLDFSMPLRSSPSDYCAMVRTLLRPPTADAAVPPASVPPPPPPVSWRFSLLVPRASAPSGASHCLLQKVPECSEPPAPAASVDTRPLLC